MGDTPIIFVPSHRSYADFILMSFACFTYNVEIPAIAAGMGKKLNVFSQVILMNEFFHYYLRK